MNEEYKQMLRHLVSMLITGAIAAGFAFFQSVLTAKGVSCTIQATPGQTGVLGSLFYSAKVAFQSLKQSA